MISVVFTVIVKKTAKFHFNFQTFVGSLIISSDFFFHLGLTLTSLVLSLCFQSPLDSRGSSSSPPPSSSAAAATRNSRESGQCATGTVSIHTQISTTEKI